MKSGWNLGGHMVTKQISFPFYVINSLAFQQLQQSFLIISSR